jgi:gamma-glutamylcyclotransferase (GGCT)/AIG2-like uncharacterized protein YtfP
MATLMTEREAVLFRLFVCATFMKGEPDHALLERAESLGPATTKVGYSLVEVGTLGGMIEGGLGAVVGELYSVDYETLAACDKKRDHPRLFRRGIVMLADGNEAHAYLLDMEQVRGRRRIRGGDWRRRFAPRAQGELAPAGAFVRWARGRHSR